MERNINEEEDEDRWIGKKRENTAEKRRKRKRKHIEKKMKNHQPAKQLPNAQSPRLEEEPPAPLSTPSWAPPLG